MQKPRNGKPRIRRRTLWGFIGAYILILVLPTALGAYVGSRVSVAYQSSVSDQHYSSLEQLRALLDMQLSTLDVLSNELLLSEDMELLSHWPAQSDPSTASFQTAAARIQKQLQRFIAANGVIEHVYLYFDDSEYILSDFGSYREDIADIFDLQNSITYNQARTMFLSTFDHGRSFFQADNGNAYVFQAALYGDRAVTTIAFEFSVREMDALFDNTVHSSAELLVLSKEGNLWHVGSHVLSDSLDIHYVDFDPSVPSPLVKDGVVILSCVSKSSHWRYLSLIPESTYNQGMDSSRRLLLSYFFTCLIGGGALVVSFALYSYHPIEKIVRAIDPNSRPTGVGTEYAYIEDSIRELQHDNAKYASMLMAQQASRIQSSLGALLSGASCVNSDAFTYLSQLNSLYVRRPGYVLLFGVDAEASESYSLEMLGILLRDRARRAFDTHHFEISVIDMYDHFAAVAVFKEGMPGTIDESIAKLIDSMAEVFSLPLRCSVSNAFESIERISDAYQEAMQSMEYHILTNSSAQIIHYSDIPLEGSRGDIAEFFDQSAQLKNLLKTQNYHLAIEMLPSIVGTCLPSCLSELVTAQSCRKYLVDIILSVLPLSQEQADAYRESLARTVPASDFTGRLQEMLRSLMEEKLRTSTARHLQKGQELINYIHDNYMRYDLSVSVIAAETGTAQDSVSQYVREAAGMNTIDYISYLRVERAKQLIAKSSMPMKKIAEVVGFGNSLSLNRAFKKHTNSTPSQYRENMRHI